MRGKLLYSTVIFLALFSYSCKVSRISSSSTDSDSTQVETNTPTLDTVKSVSKPILVVDTVVEFVEEVKIDTLTIVGVGDIMMGTNFPDPKYLPPHGGKHLLDSVAPYLKDSDLTFGNLEGVILDEGGTPKYCKNPDVCYLFRSPTSYVHHLKDAGFDVVSMANNHAGDFGDEGRKSTMAHLDSVGIYYAGLLSHPYVVIEKDSITYGMIAFSPNTGTVSINDTITAIELVSKVDSLVDVLIVSFHGGAEGKSHRNVTRETEMFYGEDRGNVYEFSHSLIDHGADIIFGHGPHVTRAMELYHDRLIAYSLGNFCTYARFNLRGSNGLAPLLQVKTDREGKFFSGLVIPVKQIGSGIPIIDQEGGVILELQELMETDFPETGIRIDEMGNILRKE